MDYFTYLKRTKVFYKTIGFTFLMLLSIGLGGYYLTRILPTGRQATEKPKHHEDGGGSKNESAFDLPAGRQGGGTRNELTHDLPTDRQGGGTRNELTHDLPTDRQGGGTRNELALNLPTDRQEVSEKERYTTFLANHPYNTRVKRSKKQMKAMGIPKKDRPDFAAELDFIKTMNPATQTVPADGLHKARQAYLAKPKNKAAIAGVNWTERGPNNVGGRTRALMFDPNDVTGKKVWAGGVAGGLWYNNDITTNTTTWQKVNDFWANMAVTAIAYDPSNAQIMYVGTGEGFADNHPAFVRGEGIWKTTNGGTTWTQLASTTPTATTLFKYVNKIAVHSSGMIFAATLSGVIRSTNGGTSWSQIYNTACSDIEIAANGDVYIGTFGGVVARTTNPTDAVQPTWTNFNPASGGQRTELAIAPSASSATGTTVLYAIASNGGDIQWFRKSSDGGATWTSVTVPKYMEQNCVFGTTDFTRGQSWYDLILRVKPNNANIVLVGGIDVYGTTNGGTSWNLLSYWTGGCSKPDVHADQHAIEFRPTNPDEAIFGNDGGVYYSTNAGTATTSATFGSRNNGYNVTQFYACAINNTSASNVYLAGAQDNGTQRFSAAGINSTTEVNGGDGGFCFIDQTNPNIAIASYTNNNFYRSTNGGVSFTSTLIGEETGLFINPADYDNTANTLYTAGDNNQYKFINNIEVSPSVPNTAPLTSFGQVSAIKANCYTSNRIFIGSTSGNLFRVDNANSVAYTTTNIGAGLPAGYISCIDVGSSDNELIVTYSSYDMSSVYYTNNGGATWINKDAVTHGLPNMPVRWALFNPNDYKQVMIATELGVWSTSDITASNPGWESTNTGLANVRCDMLRYRTSDKQVVIATFGRGLYTTNAFASTPTFTHTALSPLNGSTNVAPDVIFSMTFSSNVAKGTGNIVIKRVSDNTVLETIPVTSAAVSVAGATATIDPTLNLPASTAVYVEVATGAFTSTTALPHAGFSGNSVWQITTGAVGGAVANFTYTPASGIAYQPNGFTFTDASTGTITTRSWNFGAGATPATATTVGPHAITYNTFGLKTVTLTANGTSTSTQSVGYLPTLLGTYLPVDGGNFETDLGHYVGGTTDASVAWSRGNSAVSGKSGTASGSFAYVTGLTSNTYNNIQSSVLYTPNYNFSTAGTYTMFFSLKMATELNYDGLIVQYSTNLGSTWTNLGTSTATNWYNSTALNSISGYPVGTAMFSGTISTFTLMNFNASFLAGNPNVAFRFVFRSDESNTGAGVAIDNFQITGPFTATSFSPTNGATNVSVTENPTILFSANVVKGTSGNITFRRTSDNSIIETLPVTSSNVLVVGNSVTIDPVNNFPGNTQMYVEIASGAFLSTSSFSYLGFTGNGTWQFTTAPAGATANLNFSQQIIYQPNSVTFTDTSVGATSWSWNFGSGATPATSTLQNPPAVTYSTTGIKAITLTINGGASTATANIAVLPSLPTSYAPADGGNFETANGHNVSTANAQAMFFDRANSTVTGKDGTTSGSFSYVTGATLTQYPNQAQSVLYTPNFGFGAVGTYTLSFKTKFATEANYDGFIVEYSINNGGTWTKLGTSVATGWYNATVASNVGAGGFVAGTTLFSGTSVGFETKTFDCTFLGGNTNVAFRFVFQSDNTIQAAGVAIDDFQISAPFVATTFLPANNATNVSPTANLAITFNSPPQKNTGNIVVKRVSDNTVVETMAVTSSNVTISGNTATIDLVNDLPQSTQVYVEIANTAFRNSLLSNYAGITGNATWRFTTGDLTPPTLVTLSPVNGAISVALASNLVMTMSENVQKGTGNIVIRRSSDNSIFETINVTNAQVSIAGAVVTINPTNDFASTTQYYVEVASGAIQDLSANNYVGFAGNTTWQFTSADIVAPTLVSLNPANGATNVALASNLVMTMSENVQKGSGNIVIRRSSDNSVFETINVTSTLVTVSGAVVTINPTNDLASGIQYYVEVANGAIKDLANNNYVGFAGNTTWQFTTIDNVAPTLVTLSPANGATAVAVASNLVMTMSENVQKGTGNIVIRRSSDNSIFETINVTNAQVSVAGAVVTINPTNDLASTTQYYVEVANGAIKDLADNNYVGFAGNTTWQFTTIDNAAPTLVSLNPTNGATAVAIGTNLVITLSEVVQKGSGNITIKRSSNNSNFEIINVANANVTVAGAVVTINPTADLESNTQYYVEIASGAIQDLAGNNYAGFAGNTTWQFTSADIVAPTLVSLSPTNGATGVLNNVNLVLTLSENVQKATGNITIKRSSNNSIFETIPVTNANVTVAGAVVTINPTNDLESGTQYYVEIASGAIEDLVGNDFAGFAGNSGWQFTTLDNIAPTLVSLLPTNGATAVAVNTNLVITLNENVQKGAGNITIKRSSNNSIFETINVNNANVTVAGAAVTINPTADFESATQYYVEIAGGAIQDLAGNNYAGFAGNTTWQFTSADVTAPTLVTLNPANGATAVAIGGNLSMTFSENVQKSAGNIVIKRSSNNSVFETIPVTNVNVTVTGANVVINPTNDLESTTQYYVEVASGAIEDIAGNDFVGFSGNTTWQFTSADISAPILLTLNPANGANNVNVANNLTLTFNKNVQKATGNITIKRSSNNSIFETINVTNANVTVAGAVVTVNPTADLESSTQYYVEVANGAIEDLTGNDFGGFVGNAVWQFTSADVTAPTLITLLPAHNSASVALASNLEITLSENIQKGTGNIILKRSSNNSVFETIDVTNAQVSITGATATINPTADLESGVQYYVEIANGALKDLSGNNFAGFAGNTTWQFTSLDNTAPTLATLLPANGASNVAVATNLVITLNENIQKGTGNIVIKRSSNNSVFETIDVTNAQVSITGATATINPTANLESGVQYYVEIANGALKDLSNNNFAGFAGNMTWQFTSSDNTFPTLVSLSPANNSTNILASANLVMTFSENMQKGTSGTISIKRVSNNAVIESFDVTSANFTISGAVVTLNPSNDLPLGVQVYVEVPSGIVKDLSGNDYAGFTTSSDWRFTTQAPVDATAPLLISTSPIHNAPAFAGANNLEMTFNENIQKGTTGSLVIRKVSDNSTVELFSTSSSRVTIVGSIVTINPANDLPFNTDLYVEVSNDYFKDLAGNNFAGFSGSGTWKFKTDFSTAIEDDKLSGAIRLYPNPVLDVATLEVENGLQLNKVQARVLDANGKLVWTQEVANLRGIQKLDFTSLPAGKYFLQLTVGKSMVLKPFVKVR